VEEIFAFSQVTTLTAVTMQITKTVKFSFNIKLKNKTKLILFYPLVS